MRLLSLLARASLAAATLLLSSGCTPALDKCVEAKQDQFKREHPEENWENLVRARQRFELECRQP